MLSDLRVIYILCIKLLNPHSEDPAVSSSTNKKRPGVGGVIGRRVGFHGINDAAMLKGDCEAMD